MTTTPNTDRHAQLRALYRSLLTSQENLDEFEQLLSAYPAASEDAGQELTEASEIRDRLNARIRDWTGMPFAGLSAAQVQAWKINGRGRPQQRGACFREAAGDALLRAGASGDRTAVWQGALPEPPVVEAMDCHVDIEALYAAFCDTLPRELQPGARELALRLRFASRPGLVWSEVIKHEVTLAAPALLAPALQQQASAARVREAVIAHLLAAVEALASDFIEDRQLDYDLQLHRLLVHIRTARDHAIEIVTGGCASPYPQAERRRLAALTPLRILLQDIAALSFHDYVCLSLARQSAAFPASLALARAAGWDNRRVRAVERILEDIVLGLRLLDDVVGWEEDWHRGGAWAICLSCGVRTHRSARERTTEPDVLQRMVHESGVLVRMLRLARRRFREAAKLATALGAHRLAALAREQEERTAELAVQEALSAGYAVRAHRLASWAAQVLA